MIINLKNINEILTSDKFYKITRKNVEQNFKVAGAKRYFYFFITDSGLQYRISIVTIPSNTNLKNFIIGKYYPAAVEFINKIKKNYEFSIATLTFAVFDENSHDYYDKILTNQGMAEYIKILQTCIKLLRDFIEKNQDVKMLYFSGAFKSDEKVDRLNNISQRTSIIKTIIQKFIIPGWESKQFSNLLLLYKNTFK